MNNFIFKLFILFFILVFISCEMKNIEIENNESEIVGYIDSLSIHKRMHEHVSYYVPSFIFHVSIYNQDTEGYTICIPYIDGFQWRWIDTPTPYLWLFPEYTDTCYEAIIIDYFNNDTIITIKNKQDFMINPYHCSRTIPEFYNMYEIFSDYEDIIFGDFCFKMLNFYNGDTIIFNKADHFKIKYLCDGVEFSPLDSAKMNERLLPPGGGIVFPPGEYFSKKAQAAYLDSLRSVNSSVKAQMYKN